MRVLVITSHPWDGSYNHAVSDSLVKGLKEGGHSVELIDLNKDRFNPVMTEKDLQVYGKGQYADPKVGEYQKMMENAEHVVIIYPVWWGIMPAILKGFVDKVFVSGWAYDQMPSGMLKGRLTFIKGATVILTMNTPKFYFNLVFKPAFETIFTKGFLKSCGIKNVKTIALAPVATAGDVLRKKWLGDIENYGKGLK